ncbi:D-tagatose-bisphosphate aldolase, class II, non-catalytic subunit [Tunturiibacter gelidoferens]|uniref:D-tagatose-1,6-bisphosphate aldolase subunit GatZ/KbaZ n=1 Tax=Tunturiibacter lichenicola TaxID=2051959 RepID=A0A7Y9T4Z9_9BACT|nr:D-tagatose-bisphosphate aldolase, class II, non-catalytic subunit [Edaphobacter lichenicola]NYF54027.1 D-tagatose-1,6-bisphosphate aldolase subunit GatZ/KbaZ [Edaphobacter lichenicola]
MRSPLQDFPSRRRSGVSTGIYSVCSAHPWVIRAAAEQAAEAHSLLLVEATSNQVNQFGGYTGMRPAGFRDFVLGYAAAAGLETRSLILGGDHLGPNPWRTMPADEAMKHAQDMIAEYVQAGFTKIHLDASMSCAGDPPQLSDEVVAQRAAQLCRAAENAGTPGGGPVYVIGTEVPVPGGAMHSVQELDVTSIEAAEYTLAVHKRVFEEQGLAEVWPRVIALVVQPGVEFDHDSVVAYDRVKAKPLVDWLRVQREEFVFEAHSTDYQLPNAYAELVEDGFAILKVGPALTFAMREALCALEDIESQLIAENQQSFLTCTIEKIMLREPANWKPYYQGTPAEQKLLRLYSYSDRIRYYWHLPEIDEAVDRLIANLSAVTIPESMYSRYLPLQYARLRNKEIEGDPVSLIVDRIRDVLRVYAAGCNQVAPL